MLIPMKSRCAVTPCPRPGCEMVALVAVGEIMAGDKERACCDGTNDVVGLKCMVSGCVRTPGADTAPPENSFPFLLPCNQSGN
jgi:hypothetical protein